MKFLIGMICGLVVAIAVPYALAGVAANGDGTPPQKSPPLTHNPAGEATAEE